MTSEDPLYLCTLYSLRVERGKSLAGIFLFLGQNRGVKQADFSKSFRRKVEGKLADSRNFSGLWPRDKNRCRVQHHAFGYSEVDYREEYDGMAKDNFLLPISRYITACKNIKKIIGYCGVEEEITRHTSHHTMATEVCLINGVAIETFPRYLDRLLCVITKADGTTEYENRQ